MPDGRIVGGQEQIEGIGWVSRMKRPQLLPMGWDVRTDLSPNRTYSV